MIKEELIFRSFCFDKIIIPYKNLTEEDKKRIKNLYGWQTYLLCFRFQELWITIKDEFLKMLRIRKR